MNTQQKQNLDSLFQQVNDRLAIIGETPDAYLMMQLIEILKFEIAKNERLINKMVDRFLGWKLPADFAPDAGITFKRDANPDSPVELQYKHEPIGTNLFTAEQAKAMIMHLLEPITKHPDADYKSLFEDACANLGAISQTLGLHPDEGGATPIIREIKKLQGLLDQPEGEVLEYLLDGMRVKLNFNKMGNMTSLSNMEHELQGRWVCFVGAENGKHLKATHPAPFTPITADVVTYEMVKAFQEENMKSCTDRQSIADAVNAYLGAKKDTHDAWYKSNQTNGFEKRKKVHFDLHSATGKPEY
jgi:hypothetical protein